LKHELSLEEERNLFNKKPFKQLNNEIGKESENDDVDSFNFTDDFEEEFIEKTSLISDEGNTIDPLADKTNTEFENNSIKNSSHELDLVDTSTNLEDQNPINNPINNSVKITPSITTNAQNKSVNKDSPEAKNINELEMSFMEQHLISNHEKIDSFFKDDKTQDKSWLVKFNRDRDLVVKLSHLNGDHLEEADNGNPSSLKKSNLNTIKPTSLSTKGIALITIPFAVLITAALFFIWFLGRSETEKLFLESLDYIEVGSHENQTIQLQEQIPLTVNQSKPEENVTSSIETDLNTILISVKFPYDLKQENSGILWTVSKDDSINGLFNNLHTIQNQLVGTELEEISKMEWDSFLEIISINNPERESYHLIYPGERFFIPF
jgi:hypothetical protein